MTSQKNHHQEPALHGAGVEDRQLVLSKTQRIVVKVGSRLLLGADGSPQGQRIQELVSELNTIRKSGKEVILVTSGAIAFGMTVLGIEKRPSDIARLQALAALGQGKLMSLYEEACRSHGFHCAQILLSLDDVKFRTRHLNVRNCISSLLSNDIMPVINENDAVSIDEICFGDNDRLAALVGTMARADLTILLTSVDGFHERVDGVLADEPVSVVHEISEAIRAMAGKTDGNQFSTGGMISKLDAAETVMTAGESMVIANGEKFSILQSIMAGDDVGTLFMPSSAQLSGNKRYLAFFAEASGNVVVDEGAVAALKDKGKSLLPSGIIRVEGDFEKGATVKILDRNGGPLAIGTTNYSSERLRLITGLRSEDIRRVLKEHDAYDEAVHRNNMVIL